MRIAAPLKIAAPLAVAGVLAASCGSSQNQPPGPTESATATSVCPKFEDNGNPNALPHKTGVDVRVSGVAALVLGNFEALCGSPNRGAGVDVAANGVGGVTLRYTVNAPGGSYAEQLVLNGSFVADFGSVAGFEVTDNVTVATGNGGSSQKTRTKIDANVDDGAWGVESMLPDGSDLTYSSQGDQTSKQGAAAAMDVANRLLTNMSRVPAAPANVPPFGAPSAA